MEPLTDILAAFAFLAIGFIWGACVAERRYINRTQPNSTESEVRE